MKLIIIYPLFEKTKIIDNPVFVPRMKESIDFGINPAPKVKQILHKYEENTIFILVE